MRKIVYTRPDGGLSVVTPVINLMAETKDLTEDQAESRAWGKLPTDAINPRFVDAVDIPPDRTFRNALEDTGKVEVNMPKAQEIHKESLRQMRFPLLAALDIEYQRADEKGDAVLKAQIAAKKQALRDATEHPTITAAKTPEELKAAIPDALK